MADHPEEHSSQPYDTETQKYMVDRVYRDVFEGLLTNKSKSANTFSSWIMTATAGIAAIIISGLKGPPIIDRQIAGLIVALLGMSALVGLYQKFVFYFSDWQADLDSDKTQALKQDIAEGKIDPGIIGQAASESMLKFAETAPRLLQKKLREDLLEQTQESEWAKFRNYWKTLIRQNIAIWIQAILLTVGCVYFTYQVGHTSVPNNSNPVSMAKSPSPPTSQQP